MRIQFEIDETLLKDLASLMEKAGVHTKRELFNNALSLFEWAAKERMSGRVIGSVDPAAERYKEIVVPALEVLAKVAAAERQEAPATAAGSYGAQ